MSATSPYQNNDYQAVGNFRPFSLPINDIYKGISAQNAFWDQGAARVKNIYENALNLDLTLDANQELRKDYMSKAEKQMMKLSSMDLSDPSVQRQGFGIFRPLLQDKGIMYDDYLTKKYKDVLSEADQWKNDEKTKGEGFHMDNLAYALRSFKGFSKSTSREQLESIFKTAKDAQYTPYHDVSKERSAILDKCKPNVISKTTTQGMYLETEKANSLSAQKLWGCLEAGLSDKARQQMRISGVVRYGDDYNALRMDYIPATEEKVKSYNEEIKNLSAQKVALAGQIGSEETVKEIGSRIDQYNNQITNLQGTIVKLHDDDYIKNNYEDLASMAYMKRANGIFAEAFARKDVEESKKADPVGIMYYTQQKLDNRQVAGFAHDYKIEDYKLKQKLLLGDSNADIPTRVRMLRGMGVSDAEIQRVLGQAEKEEGTSYNELQTAINSADNSVKSKMTEIVQALQSNPDIAKILEGVEDEESFTKELGKIEDVIKKRLTANSNDVQMIEWKDALNAYTSLVNKRTSMKSILDDAEKTVTDKNPDIARTYKQGVEKVIQSIPQAYTTRGGIILSKADMTAIINDTHPSFYIDQLSSGGESGGEIGYVLRSKATNEILTEFGSPIDRMYEKIKGLQSQKEGSYKTKVNNFLESTTAVQKIRLASGNLLGKGKISQEMTATMSFISDIFGSSLGEDATFNTIGGFDPVDGWVDIQAVDSKGKSISSGDLRKAAASSTAGASIIEEGKHPNSIRIKVDYLSGVVPKPEFNEEIKNLMTYAAKRVTTENIPTGLIIKAGITPRGNVIQLKTKRSLATGEPRYTILVNGTEIPAKIGDNETAALNYINNLLTGQEDVKIK
jgi:hypothetical protein